MSVKSTLLDHFWKIKMYNTGTAYSGNIHLYTVVNKTFSLETRFKNVAILIVASIHVYPFHLDTLERCT